MSVINHLDLFSGIGGFALGLQMADNELFKTLYFCECDPYCQKILRQNFNQSCVFEDVKYLNEKDFKNIEIDLITAGFPCQDLSIAGRKKGLMEKGADYFMRLLESSNLQNQNLFCLKIVQNLFGEIILEKNLQKSFKQSGMIVGGKYYVLSPLDTRIKENELILFVGIKNIFLPTPLASDAFCIKNFSISTQMKSHKCHQKRLYPYIACIEKEDMKKIMKLIVSIYEQMMGYPKFWTQLRL